MSRLRHPWLVAVWPGMGNVALNAGFYLLSKLDMKIFAEFDANDLFDVDHVFVQQGVIQPVRRPGNRFFLWTDPAAKHDLIIFLGEAQPPIGKYPYCRQLMTFARNLGVERVFTFAAMATQMHPEHRSKVYGAATSVDGLSELRQLELEILENGPIGGLNGVLLAAAIEAGIVGCCLLGEMPHIFSQLPFPKASLAILEVFTSIARIELDFAELQQVATNTDEQLGELLTKVEEAIQRAQQVESGEASDFGMAAETNDNMKASDRQQIDELFGKASVDRSKAFELKSLLDRLGVFKEFEDRFLDLFGKSA